MTCKMVLWALLMVLAVAAANKSFQGDKVISVTPQNYGQLEYLLYLHANSELDFWNHPMGVGSSVDIHVTANQLASLSKSFKSHGMEYTTKITDIQKLVDAEKDVVSISAFSAPDVLSRYGSQQEIVSWLETKARECGDRCTLMPFGQSLEGREMNVIKIVGSPNSAPKPAVFIDGGIHAREWISPAFVNNMIDQLITHYNSDSDVQEMLAAYDFYIMPLLNPDGYQYSHDSDRMWRKNRAETTRKRCRGVDLNRNFGYQYGVDGVSTNPCSEIYLGPNAFSEPESQNLKAFLESLDNLEVYLSFHAYGQYFLYPWGYGREYAPNHNDLDDVGKAAANAITGKYSGNWIVGNAAIELYPAAGASDDWAYGGAGATYAYCIELPPSDDNTGFLLPESEIPEVVSSVWPGIKAMMKKIIEKQGRGAGIVFEKNKAQQSNTARLIAMDQEFWNKMVMQKKKLQA